MCIFFNASSLTRLALVSTGFLDRFQKIIHNSLYPLLVCSHSTTVSVILTVKFDHPLLASLAAMTVATQLSPQDPNNAALKTVPNTTLGWNKKTASLRGNSNGPHENISSSLFTGAQVNCSAG